MATQTTFTCLDCGFTVANWSDGNPYIATPDGKRHYWHHPGQDRKIREICELFMENPTADQIKMIRQAYSGREFQYICKKCYGLNMLDGNKDELKCKACASTEVMLTEELSGEECPSCRKGRFDKGQFTAIS